MRAHAAVRLVLATAGHGSVAVDEDDPVEEARDRLELAARRAFGVSLIALFALIVLIVARPAYQPFLSFGGGDTPFSLAALTVAFFAGFRLSQGMRYRAGVAALRGLSTTNSAE